LPIDEATVDPGADHEVRAWCLAPTVRGEYELEVDLFQERSGWFAKWGSRAR
jgi:hypothetical protein